MADGQAKAATTCIQTEAGRSETRRREAAGMAESSAVSEGPIHVEFGRLSTLLTKSLMRHKIGKYLGQDRDVLLELVQPCGEVLTGGVLRGGADRNISHGPGTVSCRLVGHFTFSFSSASRQAGLVRELDTRGLEGGLDDLHRLR